MRSYDKYKSSKFIQQSEIKDSPHGAILVTISKVTEENVAPENQAEKIKYIIHFKEAFKPWAPGVETLGAISNILGTGNVDDWPGSKLVLFIDPNVSFQGNITGGIRCRAPKNTVVADNAPEPDQSIQNEPTKAEFCDDCKNLKEECVCPATTTGENIPF